MCAGLGYVHPGRMAGSPRRRKSVWSGGMTETGGKYL
jgi:hypothetical protein